MFTVFLLNMDGKNTWVAYKCGQCHHQMMAEEGQKGLRCMYCGSPVWKCGTVARIVDYLDRIMGRIYEIVNGCAPCKNCDDCPKTAKKVSLKKARAERVRDAAPIIIKLHNERGESVKHLAEQYGVSEATVYRILNGKWRQKTNSKTDSVRTSLHTLYGNYKTDQASS